MPANIQIGTKTARVEDLVWTSDDTVLADYLNDTRGAIEGYDPDPDSTEAQRAASALGGEVLEAPEDEEEYPKDADL